MHGLQAACAHRARTGRRFTLLGEATGHTVEGMKPIIVIAALLTLAGCMRPPGEQAASACTQAGLRAGTMAYAQCYQNVLPSFVADQSRRRVAAGMMMGGAFQPPPAPVRMQTTCQRIGNSVNCW